MAGEALPDYLKIQWFLAGLAAAWLKPSEASEDGDTEIPIWQT